MEKVIWNGDADECWEYVGYRDKGGYGTIWLGETNLKAHRASWEQFIGPIPGGLHVCHRCDNPPCVNPAHLFLGTHADNMEDMKQKGRQARGRVNARSADLTDKDIREIRGLYATGDWSGEKLGKRFGIAQQTVSTIVLRQSWGHVQ